MSDLGVPRECAEWIQSWENEVAAGRWSVQRWCRKLDESIIHAEHAIAHHDKYGQYVQSECRKQSLAMLQAAKERAVARFQR